MPDLASRTDHEKKTAAAIYLLLRRYGRDIEDGERFAPVRFAGDLQQILVPQLSLVHADAANSMGPHLEADLSSLDIEDISSRWAKRYGRQLSREVAASIQDELRIARSLEPGDRVDALAKTFSRDRAETIGVTETTRGISAGERSVVKDIERQTGRAILAYWEIEDGAACDVCKGLNGMSEKVWGRKYPMGPPAHPWCRCFTIWR